MILKLNLARNSLRYIIRTYEIKELHIPFYLCNVVRKSIIKENCRPVFYHIDDNFMPVKTFKREDYILYPNYFGICDKNVDTLCQQYPKLIVDNAHSFYSKQKGFACFNSARKFLDVYNGSYLWIQKDGETLNTQKSPIFYDIRNENNFDNTEIMKISEELDDYINKFDDKNIRKEKFLNLHEQYKLTNNLKIEECQSPFCYPYLATTNEEADKLAKELTQKGMIIYRYWNNMPESYIEYKFYRRLVPVPLT